MDFSSAFYDSYEEFVGMSTYPNAHTNPRKWNFDVQISFDMFKNPKISGIQPTHSNSHQIGSIWCKMVKNQKYSLSIRLSQYLDSEKYTYMNQSRLSGGVGTVFG